MLFYQLASAKVLFIRSYRRRFVSYIAFFVVRLRISLLHTLAQENDDLSKQYEELLREFETLQGTKEQSEKELQCAKKEYEEETTMNEELRDYIEKIGIPNNCKNTGKDIPAVGKRHQCRKLKELKTQVERSLWFAKTMD